jgi:hypothetical protein
MIMHIKLMLNKNPALVILNGSRDDLMLGGSQTVFMLYRCQA